MEIVFQAASKAYFFIVRGPSLGKLAQLEIAQGRFVFYQICKKTNAAIANKEFTNEEDAVKWALRKRMALYSKNKPS